MSKTQLQTNNTKLEALITELQGKAAGGSGGGSVETCTVTISGSSSNGRPYYISYMTNEDVPVKVITNNSNLSVTLQNVLCGSVVTVSFYSSAEPTMTTTNAELIADRDYKFMVFKITASSDGTATIYNSMANSGGAIN